MKRVFNKRHACANDHCQLDHKNPEYDPMKCPKIQKIANMLSPEKREQYLKDVEELAKKMFEGQE